jgi:hypothetical protein
MHNVLVTARAFGRFPRAQAPVCALLLALAVLAYAQWMARPSLHGLRIAQANEDGLRKGLGLWLRDNTPPDASVAMEAIGYQGYYSQRRVIDLVGLISPNTVSYMRRTADNAQVFAWICENDKPDYIVLRSFEIDTNRYFKGGPVFSTPEQAARFDATYREVARFTAPYAKHAPPGVPETGTDLLRHLTVYQRKEAGEGK